MEYRIGKCSQCGAEYQVPASFAHNVARCKLCKGVVHLAAAKGAGAAKPAAPRPRAEARPPAEAQAPRAAPPPAPASEPPAPRPAPTERTPQPSPAREASPATTPSAPAQRAPLGLYVAAGLCLLALVLFLLRAQLFGEGRTSGADAPAGEPPRVEAPKAESGLAQPPPTEAREARGPQRAGDAPSASLQGDPTSIDFHTLPRLEPTADTTIDEWRKLEEWAAQWLDEEAGPIGEQARQELETRGRKAVPALLNFLKNPRLGAEDFQHAGDLALPFLKRVSNGTDFGWPAPGSKDLYACKLAILEWTRAWQRCAKDVEAWITLARLEQVDPNEAARLRATFGTGGTPQSSSVEQN
jgi:hypothetical protein